MKSTLFKTVFKNILVVTIALMLSSCQSVPGVTSNDGITVAIDKGDLFARNIAEKHIKPFEIIRNINGTHLCQEIVGVDGAILKMDADVIVPRSDSVSKFSLMPIKTDIELAMSIFWNDDALDAIKTDDGGYKLNRKEGLTEFISWSDGGGDARNRFKFSYEASYKDESSGLVSADEAVYIVYDILKKFGVPDMMIVYMNQFASTINFTFVPRYTEFNVVSSLYERCPGTAQAAVRPGAVEFIQGECMLEKVDESLIDNLIDLEGALEIVKRNVGGDIVVSDSLQVEIIELRHYYQTSESSDKISATPVWYFQLGQINDEVVHNGNIATGLFWVDAITGELYTAFM